VKSVAKKIPDDFVRGRTNFVNHVRLQYENGRTRVDAVEVAMPPAG